MSTQKRTDARPEKPASAQHISDLLDEALDEGFPASDPVAIHVDPEVASDDSVGRENPAGTSVRSGLPKR